MPRKASGNALTDYVRVHPKVLRKLELYKDKTGLPPKDRKPGYLIAQLLEMFEEKKIGTSPSFRKGQRQVPNPRLNEGAIESDELIYKNLYEESIKSLKNYKKVVEFTASQLGISYSDAMSMKLDATIRT